METANNQVGQTGISIPVFQQSVLSASINMAEVTMFDAEKKFSFVRTYNPKTCIDVAGFRHSIIRYKITGTNKVERPAQQVTIPQIVLPEDSYLLPDDAAKVLIGIFEDQQDAMIREALNAIPKPATISWEDISLANVLAALTATRVSSRLTKEGIELWVKAAMVKVLTDRALEIAQAKGLDDLQTKSQVAGTINAYAERLGRLSAAVPNLGEDEARSLQAMMQRSGLDDDIAKALNKKLHAILNPKTVSDDL